MRYTGPSWKLSRRLGVSLTETGKELKKRPYPPGQHGPNQRRKQTEYGRQLQEKQTLRFLYGVNERQFRRIFNQAGRMPGIQGENLLTLLESRLDNMVYRMGLARTRRGARQLVTHGHITVEGDRVDIPSFLVTPGESIGVKPRSRDLRVIKEALEDRRAVPAYLDFNPHTLEATYTRFPERRELPEEIKEALVVEYYSR